MFSRIEYLHWIEGRPGAADYDLATSDLRGSGPLQEDVVPEALVGLPDPPADVDLESQIAEVYGVEPGEVLVTAGATLANALAAGAALSMGEDRTQVLVEKPGYEPLRATPRAFGGEVNRFLRRADAGYALDADRVGAALDDEPALVSVTNRHNPSGRHSGRERLAATAEVVADPGGYLLVDEVYAPFVTEAGDGPFGGVTAAGLDGTVVTSSLTKFHGLGGLSLGWLVADREFVSAAREVAAHLPAVSRPSRALARRALFNADRLARRSRELLRNNHAELAAFVAGRDDLVGTVPDGSTYAFLGHDERDGDAVTAAAEKRGLLVVPGRFFDDPDRFRVSLGRGNDQVSGALSVLGEALDAL